MVTENVASSAKSIALRHLAHEQSGVVNRRQLRASGWTSSEIAHRLRSGRWQALHPGVYATFTGELGFEARTWGAVLRVGPEAVASHRAAGRLQGLVDRDPDPIEISVPHRYRVTATSGVRIHRSRNLDQRRHPASSMPQTRVEDTTLDLVATSTSQDDVVGWLMRACQRRLTTPPRLLRAAESRARLRWRALVLAVLDDVADGVASPLELRYRVLERLHGLPTSEANARSVVRGTNRYCDVLYRRWRLRIELEGLAWHPEDLRWRDASRDNIAVLEGDAVLRYDWRAVVGRPCETAAQVAGVLRSRGWEGRPRDGQARCWPRNARWPGSRERQYPSSWRPAESRPAGVRAQRSR